LIQELMFQHCRISSDFFPELQQWESIEFQKKNLLLVQLPFTAAPALSSASVLSLEQQQQRRRELAKRLGEMNARKREERVRNLF